MERRVAEPLQLSPHPFAFAWASSMVATCADVFTAVLALSNLGAVGAQAAAQIGGAPPKAVQTRLCTIGDVFGKLQDITTNDDCRSGCHIDGCTSGWMPTALDECNPQCGRVFEPFCTIAMPLLYTAGSCAPLAC